VALVAVSLVAELVIHKRNPVQVKFKPRSQLLHLLIKAAAVRGKQEQVKGKKGLPLHISSVLSPILHYTTLYIIFI